MRIKISFADKTVKAAAGNSGVNISNVLCSIWKKCLNTQRPLLVNDVVWEYCKISLFFCASVFRFNKNPIAAILFAQSVTLSVLSVLIGWSTLHFLATGDVGTSWLAVHVLRSDSPLPTTEYLQTTPSVSSSLSWDGEVYSAATFPATGSSWFKLNLKERATIEIKRKPVQTAAANLLPNESQVTANINKTLQSGSQESTSKQHKNWSNHQTQRYMIC